MAKYNPHTRTLTVDAFVSTIAPNTLSHELAHVYDDLVLGIGADKYEELDEAYGYAMGSFARVAEAIWRVESAVRINACARVFTQGAERWHELWSSFGQIPSRNWEDVSWSDGSRPLNAIDLSRLASFHGVSLSCKAVAAALNELAWAKGCCATFVCSANGTVGEIGTGTQINEIFK